MKKSIRNIVTLCATSLIAALGFTSCSSHKAGQSQYDQKYQEALEKLTKDDNQRRADAEAQAEAQSRLIKEAERRRQEMERQKLVYGPPTTNFNSNINR